jgi:predicted nucleic acid-binding Zn ribbon protein
MREFEEIRKVDDREKSAKCPDCDKKDCQYVPTFATAEPVLKGAGFYKNDYKGK